jgi:hypothetical protein
MNERAKIEEALAAIAEMLADAEAHTAITHEVPLARYVQDLERIRAILDG